MAIIPGLWRLSVYAGARFATLCSTQMESPSLVLRILSAVNRALHHLLFRAKQMLGIVSQAAQRDQLRELTEEARTLGSASAESISHVGAELREINARLARLESEIERIAGRLDANGAGDPLLGKTGEASTQSPSTD